MLFNSFEYLIFLPVVYILYWFVFNRSLRLQNALILLASYFFYGWWSWKFMGLLALSTLLDFGYGFFVASPNRRKAKLFLILSIVNNLGILAVFKYYNFFAEQFQALFSLLGFQVNPVLLNVALPVGISFYTFHGMSYVFDIYRQKIKPVRDFVDYAVFVSFFPLLVAGPIERANHLLPQVQQKRIFKYQQAIEGCRLILWGFFKKVVIADGIAGIVNTIFDQYTEYGGMALILGAVAFSIQIYGDFSGYSDIALGTAKLFGFELLSNFRFPYFSRDIAEFWRRWHISLSSWFRDYLYIPLGGSKEGKAKAIRNTIIIFLVSGFWHGASWNFIAWGFIHACGFLPLLLLNKNKDYANSVVAEHSTYPTFKELYQIFVTFSFVTVAWIFFRANSLNHAYEYIVSIPRSIINDQSHFFTIPNHISLNNLVFVPFLFLGDWFFRRNERALKPIKNKYVRNAIYLLVVMLILSKMNTPHSFIYFQF